MAKIESFDYGN